MSPYKPYEYGCPDPYSCDVLSKAEKESEAQKARADQAENDLKVLKQKIGDVIGEEPTWDEEEQYLVECRECGHENWELFKNTDLLISGNLHQQATNKLLRISKLTEEPARIVDLGQVAVVKAPKSLGLFGNFVKVDREARKAAGEKDIADDL